MNIDLKKKETDFSNRMALRASTYLKDTAVDIIDHFVDPEKHRLTNRILTGMAKTMHRTYVEEEGLNPQLQKSVDKIQELPATIRRIEEEQNETTEPQSEPPKEEKLQTSRPNRRV